MDSGARVTAKMSWFKRVGSSSSRTENTRSSSSPSPLRQMMAQIQKAGSGSGSGKGSETGSEGSSPSTNTSRSGVNRSTASTPRGSTSDSAATTPTASPVVRPRADTDPETCHVVFKSHWSQAWAIMSAMHPSNNIAGSPALRRAVQDDIEAVLRYVDQMVLLLVEEESQNGGPGQGPILQYLLQDDVLEKLLIWISQVGGEHADRLRLHQLKTYDLLISQSRQQLLVHKPVIRPLLKLLSGCKEHPNKGIETHLLLILHQLCISVVRNKQILELLFDATADQGPAKFLMFSLLIPYLHREGPVGQQARDGLLLIMSLSWKHDDIGKYIADNSDFCPVLATGLSGLYSSLPRKLECPSDDWYQITQEDIQNLPDLIMFLNSLEFCNAVVQVSHPLVRDQLLNFIYHGFLQPVLGPALHQNEITINDCDSEDDSACYWDEEEEEALSDLFKLPISLIESYFGSSMEEVIAATAYLDLFVRRITEPALMHTFLKFVLMEKHDEVNILESLIMRINSNSRLCMVTLSLFRTLVDLSCEDVMYQLIFKHLIPCTHVMVSQRRAVRDLDLYSKTAEKLLSLKPACCMSDLMDTPPGGSPNAASSSHTTNVGRGGVSKADCVVAQSPTQVPKPVRRSVFKRKTSSGVAESQAQTTPQPGSSSPDAISLGGAPLSPKHDRFESSYAEYLTAASGELERCGTACRCWKYPYDGENPAKDAVLALSMLQTTGTEQQLDSSGRISNIDPVSANNTISKMDDGDGDSSSVENVSATSQDSKVVQGNSQYFTCVESISRISCSHGSMAVRTEPRGSDPSSLAAEKDSKDDLQVKGDGRWNMTAGRGEKKRDSCTDSVTSEADSALSSSTTSNTDHARTPSVGDNEDDDSTPRTDSPLDDNFNNAEFSAFLLSLKRVKTPVEYCGNPEESFSEIDQIVHELQSAGAFQPETMRRTRRTTGNETEEGRLPAAFIESTVSVGENPHLLRPQAKDATAACELNKTLENGPSTVGVGAQVEAGGSMLRDVKANATSTPIKAVGTSQTTTSPHVSHTLKYTPTTPSIGPFLSTLLSKLECMMHNTLYVNLLLSGLITRLACYPQPLLRSFLLNHTLVFQPTVKSLVQVLSSVKHKVDCYSYTVKDFDSLLLSARHFLEWREEVLLHGEGKRVRADSVASLPPGVLRGKHAGSTTDGQKEKRKSFGDLLFRRNQGNNKKEPRLQLLNDKRGFRYINRAGSPDPGAGSDNLEALKAKNAVYCALVLEEFLKELAALSQEHAVLSLEENTSSDSSRSCCS